MNRLRIASTVALAACALACSGSDSGTSAPDSGSTGSSQAVCLPDSGARVGISPVTDVTLAFDCTLGAGYASDGGETNVGATCTRLDATYTLADRTTLTWSAADRALGDAGPGCSGAGASIDLNYRFHDDGQLQLLLDAVDPNQALADGTRFTFALYVPESAAVPGDVPLCAANADGASAGTCAGTRVIAVAPHVDPLTHGCLADTYYDLNDSTQFAADDTHGTLHVDAMELRSGGHFEISIADLKVTVVGDRVRAVCDDGKVHFAGSGN